jgi:hypothetical protein
MSKFKIVPSEEGISPEDAMLEFNSVYIPIGSVAERIHEIPDDQKNKIYGKMANTIDQKISKDANELGLTLNGKLHENVETVMSTYKAKIVELTEANASLKENTDKASRNEIEKLTQKVNDLTNLNEKLKGDLDTVSNEKQNIEKEFTQKEIENIINDRKNKAKSEFLIVEDISIRKACAYDESQYKFTLDENLNDVVYDLDGKVVLSKIKAGEFASFREIFQTIFTENSAHKKVTGTGSMNLDRTQNSAPVIPNRIDLSSKVTLGKK